MKSISDLIGKNQSSMENAKIIEDVKINEYTSKNLLLKPFGIVSEHEPSCKKYFFTNKLGDRISKDYYNIQPVGNNHFIVVDLDFTYSQGYESWKLIYGKEQLETHGGFIRFHYGVVTIQDGKIIEIIPTVYNNIKKTNSDMFFTFGCDHMKAAFDKEGNVKAEYVKDKIGCINLDPNSEYYGMVVAPCIFNSITDFDLEYKGYAWAYFEYNNGSKSFKCDGYISKDIDVERYTKLLKAYNNFGSEEYSQLLLEGLSEMMYTRDEVEQELLDNSAQKKIKKKNQERFNNENI